jgi:hypothetical protein
VRSDNQRQLISVQSDTPWSTFQIDVAIQLSVPIKDLKLGYKFSNVPKGDEAISLKSDTDFQNLLKFAVPLAQKDLSKLSKGQPVTKPFTVAIYHVNTSSKVESSNLAKVRYLKPRYQYILLIVTLGQRQGIKEEKQE